MASSFLLLTVVSACLLVACMAVPSTPADRIVGGFVPSSISATRNNGASVFVAQGAYRIWSVGQDGSLLFPPLDVGLLLDSGEIVGKMAADRTCSDGSRVWVQMASCRNLKCTPSTAALWLLDLSTQSVVTSLNLTEVSFDPPLVISPYGNLQLVDVHAHGVALLIGLGSLYAIDSSSGLQLSSFPLPNDGYRAIDVDVFGNVWLLQALNGRSNALMLYGYSQRGEQLYVGKPDLGDVPQQYVAAFVVDAQAVAWISLVKFNAVLSWDTHTNSKGPSHTTTLTSDYIGPILTSINASHIVLAHKVEGALELLDTSDSSSHSTVLRTSMAPLAEPHDVLYSISAQALFVVVRNTSGSQVVAIDSATGEQLYSFPIPPTGFLSNIAQTDSGGLFAQDSKNLKFAVTAVDYMKGPQGYFLLDVYNAGYAIAWHASSQLLVLTQVGTMTSGHLLFYTADGEARGSVSVPLPQGNVRSMAYATISGRRVLLQVSNPVRGLDDEGHVVLTLDMPGFDAQDLVVDDVAGYFYVLVFSSSHQCQVAVFDDSATLTEWLIPPSFWTKPQNMLGIGLDGVGNVYASSTMYSALSVWTRSSVRANTSHQQQLQLASE